MFGQTLSPRLAGNVELITGALPAQYGLRTAGIIDITTKSGVFENGGECRSTAAATARSSPASSTAARGGDQLLRLRQLSAERPRHRVARRPLRPAARPHPAVPGLRLSRPHHRRHQPHLGDLRDLARPFQIPNVPGCLQPAALGLSRATARPTFPSEDLNENQQRGHPVRRGQLSAHHRRSPARCRCSPAIRRLKFTPDPLGDLLYNGIAQTAARPTPPAGCRPKASTT